MPPAPSVQLVASVFLLIGQLFGFAAGTLLQHRAIDGGARRISPELRPASDKVFMKHDYPNDVQPQSRDAFSFPHPVVQESDDYEKDYPKDENADNGEWKAQYDYDMLRGKVAKAKKAVAMASKEEMEQAAKKREAEAAQKEATDEYDKAKAAATAKREDTARLKEEADKEAKGKAENKKEVDEATDELEHQVTDLEKCKQELAAAQQKLKRLMEENEKRAKDKETAEKEMDAKQKAEYEEAMAKGKEAEKQAQEDIAEQENQVKSAEAKADAAKKAKSELDQKVQAKKQAYEAAAQEYEASSKELESMEKDLEKAEGKLRQYRHKQAGNDGGVYVKEDKEHDPCAGCPKTKIDGATSAVNMGPGETVPARSVAAPRASQVIRSLAAVLAFVCFM